MENKRSEVGRMGEDAACGYLMDMGHTVLKRNWRAGHLEIDIITSAPDGMHFVEVKSRVAPFSSSPEENAGKRKMDRIGWAAKRFLALYPPQGDVEVWLDVVAVVFEGGRTDIEYYKGAYTPICYGR